MFMVTGGVLLLYITLPAGLIMDKFGVTTTLFISVGVTAVSYIIMIFCKSQPWLFITLYLIGALGSASLFICCLQITLSRSPKDIKGVSCSIVSASLSLSFGLWMQIFNSGGKIFNCEENCTLEQFKTVAMFLSIIIIVCSFVAWFFYRKFPPRGENASHNEESKQIPWHIMKDPKLYLLASLMLLTVFDGLTIISGGSRIWTIYGFKDGQVTYSTAFSVTNCIATILISMLIDFLIAKYKFARVRVFSVCWSIFIIIHIIVAIVFGTAHNKVAFGIVSSMMGIPFGFGLTHVPTLTSDIFGDEVYGFAFGIVQFGSIISAAGTLPLISQLEKAGIIGVFVVQIILHIITSVLLFFTKREEEMYEISPSALLIENK
jgi:MFS family permease